MAAGVRECRWRKRALAPEDTQTSIILSREMHHPLLLPKDCLANNAVQVGRAFCPPRPEFRDEIPDVRWINKGPGARRLRIRGQS